MIYSNEYILLFGDVEDFRGKGKDSPMGFSSYRARTTPKSKFDHPTVKPIDLMEFLIRHHSDPGDLILDPFAGTGSSLLAARNLGRRFIGIEKDPKHHKTINERLSETPLFELRDFVKEKPPENLNLNLGETNE